MAVSSISGATAAAYPQAGAAEPTGATRRADSDSKDSTIVISKITKTNPDGSTVTTITYEDGHTKTETTLPKFASNESKGTQGEARVTAVDILA